MKRIRQYSALPFIVVGWVFFAAAEFISGDRLYFRGEELKNKLLAAWEIQNRPMNGFRRGKRAKRR